MTRYVAFLRGVSPMNARMRELVRAFEEAGFSDVKTILGTGNVNFSSRAGTIERLQARAEAGMQKALGKSFLTFVRELHDLEALLASNPYATFRLPAKSKRVVTFLRETLATKPKLPVGLGEARIFSMKDRSVFGSYVPEIEGPLFMKLIEKTLGKQVTTRTWDTITKIVKAG